jgi:hypothetical protein
MQNGPSIWTFEKDYHGHEKVIYQRTNIYSKGVEKMGAFAELSQRKVFHNIFFFNYFKYRRILYKKVCINGVATVDFYAEDPGIVGIAFRYQSARYHYILEIGGGGDQTKFIQVRKCIDGKYTMIQRQQDKGYEKEVWYRMVVRMEKNSFKVYLSLVTDSPEQIFDLIEDGELGEGTIALMTYKTKAAFDNFKISPSSDVDQFEPEESEDVKPEAPLSFQGVGSTKKEKQFFNNEGPVKIQWDKCLVANTPEMREKHCKEMYAVDADAANNCKVWLGVYNLINYEAKIF